jgi:small conductance mechanosensitive channel
MPVHGATQLLASWWSENEQWMTALIALVITAVTVFIVDRAIARRLEAVAARLSGGQLTPEIDTRLRVLRRVIEVTIVVIGVAIAAAQFEALDTLVAPFLASSAIVAAVIGFASRQTLANAVAGVLLAVTQPLRIGDLVTFEGESGTVDDVRLTYTYLRTGAGSRIVIPNERLAAGVLRNDTVLEPTVGTEVSLWLAPEADALRALDVLGEALPGSRSTLAEITVEGTRVAVAGERGDPATKAAREAELRARAFGALRAAGLR